MAKEQAAAWQRARWHALLVASLLAMFSPGVASAQVNSNQMRQRYDKSTKSSNIDDSIKQMSSQDPIKRLDAVKALGT